jgi:non-ribosomal peptide synthetase component F
VFYRELSALYGAALRGADLATVLPPLPLQYADYAVWQREQLAAGAWEADLAYWRGQLAGAPPVLALPTDRPRPSVPSFRGASLEVTLSPTLTESLRASGRTEGATLFMTLLAVLKLVLVKYTGQFDIVVGTGVAGRTRPELERLIGCFVNPLVLRTDLSGDPTFREVLRRVKATTLRAFEHQELPFERVVEGLQRTRSQSHNPVFQLMFALQNAPVPAFNMLDLRCEALGYDGSESAKFDLSVYVTEQVDGLVVSFGYSTDLFERGTIERFAEHYRVALEAAAAAPATRISALSLLTNAARDQVLAWGTSQS